MLLRNDLVRAILAVLPLTAALPAVSDDIEGIEGYEIEPMQWEVRACSDRPLIPINDTVQEVVAKLRELNPHSDESNVSDHDDTLQKRTKAAAPSHVCYSRLDYLAATKYISDGIRYLRNIRGSSRIGPGPGIAGVSGRVFHNAGWNVVVQRDTC